MTACGIGMVGTGYMAGKHLSYLANHPQARWHALCHTPRSGPIARQWQQEYGFEVITSDYGQLLATPEVDIVWICSPNHLHFEQTRLALEAGKHVFCEKPLAMSAAEAAELSRLALAAGRRLAVGMNCRFRRPFAAVKEKMPELGRVLLIRGTYLCDVAKAIREADKPWWLDPANHPLLLTSGLVHTLDLMVWLGGRVHSVVALGSSMELGGVVGEDTLAISLVFDSGALGELTSSLVTVTPGSMSVDVYGRDASVVAGHLVVHKDEELLRTPLDTAQPVIDLQLQLENIIRAIEGKAALLNDADGGSWNLSIAESIQESLASGRAARVAYER